MLPYTIGVIIVSFNTRDLLHGCLESLRLCSLPLHVVVVDNASHDGSAALVREEFPTARLIEPGRNLGFAAATNAGLRVLLNSDTPPDYLLLLNPDTIVQPGAIETLAAFLSAHPRVGAVGPQLLNPDGSIQAGAFRFPTLAMTLLDLFPPGEVLPGRLYGSWWHGRYPQERASTGPFPIDHPLGACIMTRPEVVTQVGVLDEGFFMYAEEVDWCYRVKQAGWAIWQVPEARVIHIGGASTRQVRARMLVALYTSRIRFFRKHYDAHTIRWHSYSILAGMLRSILLAWRDYNKGALDRNALRERLWAYGTIMGLLR